MTYSGLLIRYPVCTRTRPPEPQACLGFLTRLARTPLVAAATEGTTTLHDHSMRDCNRHAATGDWQTESAQQPSLLENSLSANRRLLGLQTRTDVDAFLKDRGVELEYTAEDLERDRETLKRFGV